MPSLNIISWNSCGTNGIALAAAIVAMPTIDLVLIQEAPTAGGHALYGALGALVGYTLIPSIRENATRQTPTGQNIALDPSVTRSYAILYRNAAFAVAPAPALVDYTADPNYVVPNSAFNAGTQGYGLRPPLRITATDAAANAVIIYSWHAPVGMTNAVGLGLFNGSTQLANDVVGGNVVIIAADMNTPGLGAAQFAAFQGIQDGLDYLLAANTIPPHVVDLRLLGTTTGPQILTLNALFQAPHWAVPGRVSY